MGRSRSPSRGTAAAEPQRCTIARFARDRNVLFFGQFTSMPLREFQESLAVLMKDRRLLYAHLGRQLYHMGESLNGKYRYLQLAYGAFLASTSLATVVFVLMYATGRFNPLLTPRNRSRRARIAVRCCRPRAELSRKRIWRHASSRPRGAVTRRASRNIRLAPAVRQVSVVVSTIAHPRI